MQKFIEATKIALLAIWANKLRSLLTVIGNVVAVTSIIAVVSLVQGLNASVQDVIEAQFTADAFSVTRMGLSSTDDEQLRQESNPRVTLEDADAIKTFGSNVGLVMAESGSNAQVKYRNESLDSVNI